jgi:UDP-glucose-4-epimerase GalE
MLEHEKSVCLVTGGAGYIGSHTVRRLLKDGHQVIILDNLSKSSLVEVDFIPIVIGDIDDRGLVTRLCVENRVTSVIHFAGLKNVGESSLFPAAYFKNNVSASLGLIETVIAAGVKNFVFSSSCSVVGNPTDLPVNETSEVAPESVYAITKATVEIILKLCGRLTDFNFVNLRYFNAAGASLDNSIGEDWDNTQNLIPTAMKAVFQMGPPLKFYGKDYDTPDGTCIRDYVHVEDLAAAHLLALEYLQKGGKSTTLNLGTGTGTSVKKVLETIESIAGKPVPHTFTNRRLGDPSIVFADASAASEVLGWVPQYGLYDIIQTAFAWHLKNA